MFDLQIFQVVFATYLISYCVYYITVVIILIRSNCFLNTFYRLSIILKILLFSMQILFYLVHYS